MSTYYNKYKRQELPEGWGVPAGSPKGTPVGLTLDEETKAKIVAQGEAAAAKLMEDAQDEERFAERYGGAWVPGSDHTRATPCFRLLCYDAATLASSAIATALPAPGCC